MPRSGELERGTSADKTCDSTHAKHLAVSSIPEITIWDPRARCWVVGYHAKRISFDSAWHGEFEMPGGVGILRQRKSRVTATPVRLPSTSSRWTSALCPRDRSARSRLAAYYLRGARAVWRSAVDDSIALRLQPRPLANLGRAKNSAPAARTAAYDHHLRRLRRALLSGRANI